MCRIERARISGWKQISGSFNFNDPIYSFRQLSVRKTLLAWKSAGWPGADKVAICVSLWVLFDLSALCLSFPRPSGPNQKLPNERERELQICAQCRTLCLTSTTNKLLRKCVWFQWWFLGGMFEFATRSVYGMNTLKRCCWSCFNNWHPGTNLLV